jgi:hypothetical protein
MTAIARRSNRTAISIAATLATADDVDGTVDNTQAFDVTGASRLIVYQVHDGTAGTAGIDVVEISKDGGVTWSPDSTLLLDTANDATGTIAVGGAMNAAGVDTVGGYTFKSGPHEGPTAIRVGRKTTSEDAAPYPQAQTGGTTWTTGAPTVKVMAIGMGSGALTALA